MRRGRLSHVQPRRSHIFYHVVTQRHQALRSTIFTSNKPPDDWGGVLHDDDLAAAIVDRVLERGRLLKLDGPSMRTKHLGLDAPAHAAAGSKRSSRMIWRSGDGRVPFGRTSPADVSSTSPSTGASPEG